MLAPAGGMAAGVDVRGGGPATHETDLLAPTASVERIHAVVLTGGSAYGLAACTGVMNGLADRGIGLPVGPSAGEVVPLVPGAALFDLGRGGDFRARPTAEFGALALAAALGSGRSSRAAPAGCRAGQRRSRDRRRDQQPQGRHRHRVAGAGRRCTVAALVVVNAAGSPIDPRTGELLGAHLLLPADGRDTAGDPPAPTRCRRSSLTAARRRAVRRSPPDAGRAARSSATPPWWWWPPTPR